MISRAALLAPALLLAASCTGGDRGLVWDIVVPDALRGDVLYVLAAIHEGDCSDPGLARYRTEIAPSEAGPAPPLLAPGLYAFSATAIDDACTPVGAVCQTVTLPMNDGEAVTLTVAASTGTPLCAPSECTAGRCSAGDGGVTDGALTDGDAPDATVPCALGARTDAGCFTPSNVPAAALEELGDADLVVPAAETWMLRTDTGAIEAYDARPVAADAVPTRVIREAGEGLVSRIGFHLADQIGASTRLGVFTFGSIEIPVGSAVSATGDAALVLVAATRVEVLGELSVAAAPFETPAHMWTDWATMPGPGGGAGGVRCSEETTPGENGGGPGGGAFGAAVGGNSNQGGGGGASHGGSGGQGGLGNGGVPGGRPGSTYGGTDLRPIQGGSGGGPGGEADCGKGGAGGGALQIIAGQEIVVTGVVDASGAPGAGGRGGSDAGAGGGGGSGGSVLFEAPTVQVAGTLRSNGGGGGAGSDRNVEGARGQSGAHGSLGPDAPGGGGGGVGGAGGAGSSAEGAAGNGGGDENGGGGGGGAGWLRINSDPDGASIDDTALLAPSAASGLMSVGTVIRTP